MVTLNPRAVLAVGAAAATGIYAAYRRDMRECRARAQQGAAVAATRSGPIQFVDVGEGPAVLVIHGAGGGCDQGLQIASAFDSGYRIIAPSRFGYLATPVPADASIPAQAEAHAALLDHLGVDRAIVVGASAGAPSAIELALRHPDRVSALILLVPRAYDPGGSVGVDRALPSRAVLRLVEASADFAFWLATRTARAALVRFLGIPPHLERHAPLSERRRVTAIMRGILPLSERVRGIELDSADMPGPWPLADIRAPTLVISAEDDLFRTLPGARFTAEGIPGAELRVLANGGHLMLGQQERVRRWIEDFLDPSSGGARASGVTRAPADDGAAPVDPVRSRTAASREVSKGV
jgi:pimeloyl-ACP methyl ester carboxylesterase